MAQQNSQKVKDGVINMGKSMRDLLLGSQSLGVLSIFDEE